MVSYENLHIIYLRMQEFNNKDALFGSVNVLLLGHTMQLPPVKEHCCLEQPISENKRENRELSTELRLEAREVVNEEKIEYVKDIILEN